MKDGEKQQGYWFLVQLTYRCWADVYVEAKSPEEARRLARDEMQIDWSRSELIDSTVTLTEEEETSDVQRG